MTRCTRNNVIKFVSELRQVGGFLWVLRFHTTKTDCHNITEILLKMALNTINPTNMIYHTMLFSVFCHITRIPTICVYLDLPYFYYLTLFLKVITINILNMYHMLFFSTNYLSISLSGQFSSKVFPLFLCKSLSLGRACGVLKIENSEHIKKN